MRAAGPGSPNGGQADADGILLHVLRVEPVSGAWRLRWRCGSDPAGRVLTVGPRNGGAVLPGGGRGDLVRGSRCDRRGSPAAPRAQWGCRRLAARLWGGGPRRPRPSWADRGALRLRWAVTFFAWKLSPSSCRCAPAPYRRPEAGTAPVRTLPALGSRRIVHMPAFQAPRTSRRARSHASSPQFAARRSARSSHSNSSVRVPRYCAALRSPPQSSARCSNQGSMLYTFSQLEAAQAIRGPTRLPQRPPLRKKRVHSISFPSCARFIWRYTHACGKPEGQGQRGSAGCVVRWRIFFRALFETRPIRLGLVACFHFWRLCRGLEGFWRPFRWPWRG